MMREGEKIMCLKSQRPPSSLNGLHRLTGGGGRLSNVDGWGGG